MKTIKELAERLSNNVEVDKLGPAPLELVSEVESRLEVRFPADFVEFLSLVGGVMFGDSSINGVARPIENPAGGLVFSETMRARDEYGLQARFVVLETEDDEFLYCLDTASGNGSVPVVGIELPALHVEQFAPNFQVYLNEFVTLLVESE